ncbi:MAG: prohead protease [Hydrogenophilales bacterium 28-61-23]|nr:MAG: prohead protease [Hydrogenophilales bacterium 28-61-23]
MSNPNSPHANSLLQACADHLAQSAPFDGMSPEHRLWLAERLKLAYYGKGETLLEPANGKVDKLFIVKQGVVTGEQGDANAWLELHEGESFPLGALLSERAAFSHFKAKSDVFTYELDAADFHELLKRSLEFHDFCTRRLASLLEKSQRGVQASYATATSEQQSLRHPLASISQRKLVTCAPDTPLRAALETIRASGVGAIVVVEGEVVEGGVDRPRPVGIFTVRDLIGRVILPGLDLATPMRAVMTPDPMTLPSSAPAFEAALMMARHGFRHVLVVEGDKLDGVLTGVLTGVVSEKDLFSLQRVGVTQLSSAIRGASDQQLLQQAARGIRQLGHNMMAQGVAAEQLTQILSTLNDILTRRVIELECADSGQPGGCARAFCWLSFGSEGRLEQTLSTDQDNGILFTLHVGETADAVRAQLLPLAARINRALDACGFPLCRGETMAMNPNWCLSLEEWQNRFARWIDAGDPESLLNASIFFDFRPQHGQVELADRLRAWLLARAAAAPGFLHRMAANALRNRPPLGLVRDFVVDSEGEHAHTLDLKLNGATPFVDAARLFALASGAGVTGTAARLRAAGPRLNIASAEIEAWISAFFFIQMLRLRDQHEKNQAGVEMDNRIDPDKLNDLDRRILKEAFRQARKVQARLALDYKV